MNSRLFRILHKLGFTNLTETEANSYMALMVQEANKLSELREISELAGRVVGEALTLVKQHDFSMDCDDNELIAVRVGDIKRLKTALNNLEQKVLPKC